MAYIGRIARQLALWIAGIGTSVCAGAIILGQGGRFNAAIDIVNNFLPIWTAAGMLFALAWFACGGKIGGTAGLVGLALFSGIFSWVLELGGALPAPRESQRGESVKIVQFNVWGRNTTPHRTAQWLAAQDADFIVLEEAAAADPHVWEPLRKLYPHVSPCARPQCSSVIILSRRPPTDQAILSSAVPNNELGVWARYGSGKSRITIAAVHLHRPLPGGAQAVELKELPEMLRALDQASLIVTGDFNAAPGSFALSRLDKALGLDRLTRGLATWPTPSRPEGRGIARAVVGIDHVYVGHDWRKVEVRRGPDLGSDHHPVVVTLTRDKP